MHKNRIGSLDSMRGIAALVVVIFHCLISFPIFHNATYQGFYENWFIKISNITPLNLIWAGNQAVLLFFILSGYVLSLPFLKRTQPNYFIFAVKRFFRIYVPYIVVMFISVLLLILFADFQGVKSLSSTFNERWNHPITYDAILAYLLMINYDTTNVNGVVWSLYHEMRISLVFPLLMIIVMKYKWIKASILSTGIILILFLSFSILSNFFVTGLSSALVYSLRETSYYALFFVFGTILAKQQQQLKTFILSKNPLLLIPLFILALIFINNKWMSLRNNTLEDMISGFGIVMLFITILNSVKIRKQLNSKPLLFLGKISYSLYLVHIPVMMILKVLLVSFVPDWLVFILVPIVSIPISYLSYKFIELPSINFGKKMIIKLENSPYKVSGSIKMKNKKIFNKLS